MIAFFTVMICIAPVDIGKCPVIPAEKNTYITELKQENPIHISPNIIDDLDTWG